ncbi:hypothetical protein E2C01_009907 [Portunus trituberculatus]|uniref:Uncharacterized protein n=1 Tax=Portunus trituberculatus TaxID=210409 RepID=A0A5B7D790_PORTR|nr:hypothetical protein [Portunus trituberculatus]
MRASPGTVLSRNMVVVMVVVVMVHMSSPFLPNSLCASTTTTTTTTPLTSQPARPPACLPPAEAYGCPRYPNLQAQRMTFTERRKVSRIEVRQGLRSDAPPHLRCCLGNNTPTPTRTHSHVGTGKDWPGRQERNQGE